MSSSFTKEYVLQLIDQNDLASGDANLRSESILTPALCDAVFG